MVKTKYLETVSKTFFLLVLNSVANVRKVFAKLCRVLDFYRFTFRVFGNQICVNTFLVEF